MKERNSSLDSLKLFCIFGVICIHTLPFNNIDFNCPLANYIGTSLNTIFRVCVPLFFMTTGYFFYTKANTNYVKKYIKNLIKILVLWITIYIFYDVLSIIKHNSSSTNLLKFKLIEYFKTFNLTDLYYATGIIKYHLWYLIAMILLVPFLFIMLKKHALNKAIIIGLFLNISGILMPIFTKVPFWKVRDALFFGFFYVFLGAYIKENEFKFTNALSKISKAKHIFLIISLFACSLLERFSYNHIFTRCGVYFFTTIPLTITIFIFCLRFTTLFKDSIISTLGKNTLSIYVIHPLIMSIFESLVSHFNFEYIYNTILWQIIYSPIIFILSYISYKLISSLKDRFIILSIKATTKSPNSI